MISKWLRARFERLHGVGSDKQFDLYRCTSCQAIVTWARIRSGGCRCGELAIRPTNPTLIEKFYLLVLPWKI